MARPAAPLLAFLPITSTSICHHHDAIRIESRHNSSRVTSPRLAAMPPGVAPPQSSFSRAGATTPGPPSSFARAATPGRAAANQQASGQTATAANSSFGSRNGQQQQQGQAPGNSAQQPYTGPFHPSTMMFGNGGQTQQPHSFSSSFPQTPGRVATPSFPASFGTATEHATATPTPSARSTQHQRAATARPKTPAPESRDPRLQNRGQSRPPTATQPQGQGQGQPQTPLFRSSFPNNNATLAAFSGAAGPAEQSSFKAPAAMAQPPAASTTRLSSGDSNGSAAAMPPPQARPSTSDQGSTNQRATAAPTSGPKAPATPTTPARLAAQQQQKHSNLGPSTSLANAENAEPPSASQGNDTESPSAVTTPSGGNPTRETSSARKKSGRPPGWTEEEDERLLEIMAHESDATAVGRAYVAAYPDTPRSKDAVKQRSYSLRNAHPHLKQAGSPEGSRSKKRSRSKARDEVESSNDGSEGEEEDPDFEARSTATSRDKRRKSAAPEARCEAVIATGRQSRNSIAAAVEAAQPGASIGLASASTASTSTGQQQQQRQGPDYREVAGSEGEDEEGVVRQQRRRRRGRPSRRSPAAATTSANGNGDTVAHSGSAGTHYDKFDQDEEVFRMHYKPGHLVVSGAATAPGLATIVKPNRLELFWTPSNSSSTERREVIVNGDADGEAAA